MVTSPVEDLGIPEGVREVVGRRLTRLAEATNRALSSARWLGWSSTPRSCGRPRTSGRTTSSARWRRRSPPGSCRRYREAGPAYRFGHALVRATLYDELSGARRVAVHRRVAEAIEAVHGGASTTTCRRWPTTAPGRWRRAMRPQPPGPSTTPPGPATGRWPSWPTTRRWRTTARRWISSTAFGGGPARILEGRRVELLITLGEAQRRAGDAEHRTTLLDAGERARQRGDADALARAALANCRPGYISGAGCHRRRTGGDAGGALDATAIPRVRQQTMDPATLAVRARLLAGLAVELVYGQRHRDRRVARATRHSRSPGPSTTRPRSSTSSSPASLPSTRPPPCRNGWPRPPSSYPGGAIDDPQTRFMAHWQARAISRDRRSGHRPDPRRRRPGPGRRARAAGLPLDGALDPLRPGTPGRSTRRGGPARRGGIRCRRGRRATDVVTFNVVQRWMLGFEHGRLDEIEPDLAAVVARVEESSPAAARSWPCCTASAAARSGPGRPSPRSSTAATTCPTTSSGLVQPGRSRGRPPTRRPGRRRRARQPAGAPRRAVLGRRRVLGRAILPTTSGCSRPPSGRLDAAVAHFADAATTLKTVGAPAHLGRNQVAWARVLLARRAPGDVDQARSLLTTAVAEAQDRGYVTVQRRAGPLLDQL